MRAPLLIVSSVLACGLAMTACETAKPGSAHRTGHSLLNGFRSARPQLLAQKAAITKTSTPPKAVPEGLSSGSGAIVPPPITAGLMHETWEFREIDVGGDGQSESGVALHDAKTDTLYLWFSIVAVYGKTVGHLEEFEAFVWISDASVGLILDSRPDGGREVTGCVDNAHGFSGWMIDRGTGAVQVKALEEYYH